MLQRPDPQSFTKFLASVGLFLCILALAGPGLVLRETKVLQIEEVRFGAYTPLAREELERRQAVARDVAFAAPYVGGALFLLGIGTLIYSVPRLRRQERTEDERLLAELEKLRRDIAPQDESDRRTRIEAEVSAESPATDSLGPQAVDDDQAPSERETAESEEGTLRQPLAEQAHARADLRLRVADVEERVLRQITQIAKPLYELRPQVKVGRSSLVLLDGLLVSSIQQLPDIAIEIKFVRSMKTLLNRVRDAVLQLDRYRAAAHLTDAKLWLIVVTETEPSAAALEKVARLAAESGDDVVLSVVQESRIEELQLPRDRLL